MTSNPLSPTWKNRKEVSHIGTAKSVRDGSVRAGTLSVPHNYCVGHPPNR